MNKKVLSGVLHEVPDELLLARLPVPQTFGTKVV